jgi:hypothetical protein
MGAILTPRQIDELLYSHPKILKLPPEVIQSIRKHLIDQCKEADYKSRVNAFFEIILREDGLIDFQIPYGNTLTREDINAYIEARPDLLERIGSSKEAFCDEVFTEVKNKRTLSLGKKEEQSLKEYLGNKADGLSIEEMHERVLRNADELVKQIKREKQAEMINSHLEMVEKAMGRGEEPRHMLAKVVDKKAADELDVTITKEGDVYIYAPSGNTLTPADIDAFIKAHPNLSLLPEDALQPIRDDMIAEAKRKAAISK